jgi:HD-GYP domain-containing protein (c-di-GMP phosphodiesterase class II)
MGLNDEEREDISLAASIHDIGSSQHENGSSQGSSSNVKEGSRPSGNGSQTHNERLGRILAMIPGMKNSADIIRFYCENFDGTGYPHKLSGDQIPLASKILRVADEYDHLTQPRDKSASIDDFRALESLRIRSISEFDPRVVSALELLLAHEMTATTLA